MRLWFVGFYRKEGGFCCVVNYRNFANIDISLPLDIFGICYLSSLELSLGIISMGYLSLAIDKSLIKLLVPSAEYVITR